MSERKTQRGALQLYCLYYGGRDSQYAVKMKEYPGVNSCAWTVSHMPWSWINRLVSEESKDDNKILIMFREPFSCIRFWVIYLDNLSSQSMWEALSLLLLSLLMRKQKPAGKPKLKPSTVTPGCKVSIHDKFKCYVWDNTW